MKQKGTAKLRGIRPFQRNHSVKIWLILPFYENLEIMVQFDGALFNYV
jgi:hypothetical protein